MQDTETPIETESLPLAMVQGQTLTALPKDLYIPPDALEVFLEAFQGPLDLLLYLIKKQNIDILEIPVTKITQQYMRYIEHMQVLNFELAAEYLLMAAMLAEIKSRMLLPRNPELEPDEGDPRAELIRRLQEYERFKTAAEQLDALPRVGRDLFLVEVDHAGITATKPAPTISLADLLLALQDVMKRAELTSHHHIQLEPLSIRERMSEVLQKISNSEFTRFSDLFSVREGRQGVVVTFIAILELLRQSMLDLVQHEALGPIHVKAVA